MKESYQFAQVNYYLAQFDISLKNDEKAILLLVESKSIIRQLGDKDYNLLFSKIVEWLEMLYSTSYDVDKLVFLYTEAANHYKSTEGSYSLNFIRAIRKLSNLYDDDYKYKTAIIFIDSAINQLTSKKMIGKDSIAYAYCLGDKAQLELVVFHLSESES